MGKWCEVTERDLKCEEAYREGGRVVIGPPPRWIAEDQGYHDNFVDGSSESLYWIAVSEREANEYYDYEYWDDPAVSGDYDRSRT